MLNFLGFFPWHLHHTSSLGGPWTPDSFYNPPPPPLFLTWSGPAQYTVNRCFFKLIEAQMRSLRNALSRWGHSRGVSHQAGHYCVSPGGLSNLLRPSCPHFSFGFFLNLFFPFLKHDMFQQRQTNKVKMKNETDIQIH